LSVREVRRAKRGVDSTRCPRDLFLSATGSKSSFGGRALPAPAMLDTREHETGIDGGGDAKVERS